MEMNTNAINWFELPASNFQRAVKFYHEITNKELQLFEQMCQRPSVLLIDDLPAELDRNHIQCLANWLLSLNTQVFVTGINTSDMEVLKEQLNNKPCKVFHVKHGEITECNP